MNFSRVGEGVFFIHPERVLRADACRQHGAPLHRAAASFNQSAAANGLSALRSRVAGVRERTVRSTAAPEAVAELGRSAGKVSPVCQTFAKST